MHTVKCPYGKPGDRLWVRESVWIDIEPVKQLDPPQKRAFFPDTNKVKFQDGQPDGDSPFPLHAEHLRVLGCQKLVPSIHMPRWASRINLEITAIRVERLNDISEEDAEVEGITWRHCGCQDGCAHCDDRGSREIYQDLWESINGPGSWALNPWVWVVEFKVLKGGPEA